MEESNLAHGDVSEPVATGPDMSRPVATSDDYISIKEARAIFISKKRKITERTLQRYCEKQYLDGRKLVTGEGEKWFVLRSSVLTRIAELDEFDKLRPAPTSDDMSSPVAEANEGESTHDKLRQENTSEMSQPVVPAEPSRTSAYDTSRLVATGRDNSEDRETHTRDAESIFIQRERELTRQAIGRLEIENEGLRKDKEKLYELLDASNVEKRLLIESDRDTKAIAKNNNSLLAYFGQLFKGKDALDVPVRDTSYRPQDLTDTLAGDERGT